MNRIIFSLFLFLFVHSSSAQIFIDSTINSSTKKIIYNTAGKFSLGCYGEAHYNAPIESGKVQNGKGDLHRVILFMGYKFNSKLQFFSEIEFEHVKEVYVEQAFINYSFNSALNFKTGVILIPMGYVNEFHEPTLFNGVERPTVDKTIIPTTWRELGFGIHGLAKKANIKYQLYVVNGFNGYDNGAKISGSGGVRSARQKAAEVIIRKPSLTGKVTFYGIEGLHLSASAYYGQSETSLYNSVDVNDPVAIATADSSIVGIGMASLNAEYKLNDFKFRAVGVLTSLSNTDQYNTFTNSSVASQMMGYYGEASYDIRIKNGQNFPKFIPFIRYENFDTHFKVNSNITRNDSYSREILTGGLGFQLTPGTIFKADYQWWKTASSSNPTGLFNLGFGFWF